MMANSGKSIVVGVDPAYGASGRTGLDLAGELRELRGAVTPATMLDVLRSAWTGPHVPGRFVLAVEWPFIPEPPPPGAPQKAGAAWRARAEGALQLAAAAAVWAAIGSLLGARVLTPSAVQWRPWLVSQMRAAGMRAPAVGASREQWKAAAVRFTGVSSDHQAEARCIRGWAERHVGEGIEATDAAGAM